MKDDKQTSSLVNQRNFRLARCPGSFLCDQCEITHITNQIAYPT